MVFLIRDTIRQRRSATHFVITNPYIKTAHLDSVFDFLKNELKFQRGIFGMYLGCKTLKCRNDRTRVSGAIPMSSFKSTVERIRALETERKNLLLEIEELKRMADAKAKALEGEINMLRDEVKSLRLLLSGEETETDFGQRKKR
jgi:hypothetical protein